MEIATILLGIALVLAAATGIFAVATNSQDSPAEEAAEEVVESLAETALGLPDGTLNIDLTPGSTEEEKPDKE
jgi:flagellar basal body-associated protein FliL